MNQSMRLSISVLCCVIALLPSYLGAQQLDSDTLVLKTGETAIGRVVNYPPVGDIVVFQTGTDSFQQISLGEIAGIYVPSIRMESLSLPSPNPFLSILSSMIIPGLGQMINGQVMKGFGFTALFLAGGFGTFVAMVAANDKYAGDEAIRTFYAIGAVTLAFYAYQIVDAGFVAHALQVRAEKICPSHPYRTTRSNQSSYFQDGISLTIGVPF